MGVASSLKMKSTRKLVIRALAAILILWAIGCGLLYGIMCRPPEQFGRFMAKLPAPVAFLVFPFETLWMHARAGQLRIGDPAPDFSLQKLDKTGQVQLSALTAQGRPVVLIFGSYT